jgi:hypothetical protein
MSAEHYKRYNSLNFKPQSGFNELDYAIAHSLQNNAQLSTSNEPSITYEEVEHYLCISSRDRDVSLYPETNSYVVHLQSEFKNISSIELIQAIIPDKNSVTHEPYLLLKIQELEDVMVSSDRNISDSFAILQLSPPVTNNGFIQIDKRIHENTIKHFRTPKASLKKMTVSITDYEGTPFDFGADSPNPPEKNVQNTFVFKITCMEKRRESLNHRNVY